MVNNMVLGKLLPRKIAPSPNSNANAKPNHDPDRSFEDNAGNCQSTEVLKIS